MSCLVILDSGHGLNTQGKRTPLFDDGTFMRENEFNRSVVRKIDSLLEQYENIDVVFTTTEKRDISLDERVTRVNSLYDKVKTLYDKIVLVSVHANALNGIWGTQNGTSTYHYPTNIVDKTFAEIIHKNLLEKTTLKDRGVLGGNFQIIRDVKMTACLCECAFMDNLTEAKLLLTDEFRQACAEGIVNGLKEYFGMRDIKVDYKKYSDRIHEQRGDVKDFSCKVVNKSNRKIEEPYCVGGSFQWWSDATRLNPYPTSILIQNGVILRNEANHLYDFNAPQSVIYTLKNGEAGMKRVKYATELDYKNIKCAVGGLGLVNTLDKSFVYSPVTEGFKQGYNVDGKWKDYSDVLRVSNKTVYGYNMVKKKFYILVVKNMSMTELLKLITDNSTGEMYHFAVMGDGGGAVFMNTEDKMVVYGDGRTAYSIVGFGL